MRDDSRTGTATSAVRRGAIENFSYIGLASVAGSVLALVATTRVARVLGAESFGTYNLARAIVEYALLPVGLGVTAVAIREIARRPEGRAVVAGRAVTIRALIGVLSLATVLFVAFLIDDPSLRLLMLTLSPMVVSQSLDIGWLFTAYENQRPPALINTVGRTVYFLLVMLLVRTPGSAWIVASVLVVELTLTTVLQWCFRPGPASPLGLSRRNRQGIVDHLRESLPIAAGQLGYRLKTNVDVLLLGALAPRASLGVYAAGYRLVLFVNTLAALLSGVLMARVSRAAASEGDRRDLLDRTFRLTCVVGMGLALGGGILSEGVMALLFGPEYASGGPVAAVLMLGAGFIMVSSSLSAIVIAFERSRRYAQVMWGAAALNIAVNLVAIPRWGITGAAWATTVTEALLALTVVATLWRDGLASVVRARWVWKMVLVAVSVVLLFQVPGIQEAHVVIEGTVLLMAYGLLVLATGVASLSDLRPKVRQGSR